MLTHLSVAWFTIWAVSCISTMKLLELLSMLSEVPMRVKSLSTSLTDANLAGTKLPICAMMTIRATCMVTRMKTKNISNVYLASRHQVCATQVVSLQTGLHGTTA